MTDASGSDTLIEWVQRLVRALPDRPLSEDEIKSLEATDGPVAFLTYVTILSPTIQWQEHGFLATRDGTHYALVYEDPRWPTDGGGQPAPSGWCVLARDTDWTAICDDLNAWVTSFSREAGLPSPIRFSGDGGGPS